MTTGACAIFGITSDDGHFRQPAWISPSALFLHPRIYLCTVMRMQRIQTDLGVWAVFLSAGFLLSVMHCHDVHFRSVHIPGCRTDRRIYLIYLTFTSAPFPGKHSHVFEKPLPQRLVCWGDFPCLDVWNLGDEFNVENLFAGALLKFQHKRACKSVILEHVRTADMLALI